MSEPVRQVLTYEDHEYGFRYVIEYAWNGRFYVMYVKDRPKNPYPNVHQHSFHILDVDRICVTQGREPTTLERAKAIAYVWMRGYSQFVKTGRFPNPSHRVNIPDAQPPQAAAQGAPPPVAPPRSNGSPPPLALAVGRRRTPRAGT